MNEVYTSPLLFLSFSIPLTDAALLVVTLIIMQFQPNVQRNQQPGDPGGSLRVHQPATSSNKSRLQAVIRQHWRSSSICRTAPHGAQSYSQLMHSPQHFPISNDNDSAATEPNYLTACLNREQSSRPRTFGANTKTSRALQGPQNQTRHSDVVNNSTNAGLLVPIARSPLNLINFESETYQCNPRHCPNWTTRPPRNSPEYRDPLPPANGSATYKSTQASGLMNSCM